MLEYFDKLVEQSQSGNMSAKIMLFFDWYYELDMKHKAIETCLKLRKQNLLFEGMYHHLLLTSEPVDEYTHFVSQNKRQRQELAFKIFRTYANKQNPDIETHYVWNMIGFCYHYGLGVKRRQSKAIKWFSKAAKAGNKFSYCNLGNINWKLNHVKKSIQCYERAAAEFSKLAIVRLAHIHNDYEPFRDLHLAYYWYTQAIDLSSDDLSGLEDIIIKLQIPWSVDNHRFWPNPGITLGSQRISFKQQILMLLMVSKYRHQSTLKYTSILSKDITFCIIHQLSSLWQQHIQSFCSFNI